MWTRKEVGNKSFALKMEYLRRNKKLQRMGRTQNNEIRSIGGEGNRENGKKTIGMVRTYSANNKVDIVTGQLSGKIQADILRRA